MSNWKQFIKDGSIVMVSGYEMTVSNAREVIKGGEKCIEFKGTCTDNPRNDPIRNTGYNGGTYGGNAMDYDWESKPT